LIVFIRYIRDYFREDFKLAPHLVIAIFLAVTITLNYVYHIYDNLTAEHYKHLSGVAVWWGFYAFAFFAAILIVSYFKPDKKPLYNKNFLLFGCIGLVFLSLDSCYYLVNFAEPLYPRDPFVSRWVQSCISNLSSFFSVIIPLYILYFSVKHFKPELFGFRLNGARVLPYFWLILGMIPLIMLASLRPDFLETYPTYKDNFEYMLLGVDQWVTAGIYELCYGFDFISVELFFRGFMVVALSRFVGKDAILPMVVVYAFLHFGKPAGETVSSVFGGYILGILSYSSRNIYGGLVAHLGVAWGMEYFAFLRS
jgi:hypothetical protein